MKSLVQTILFLLIFLSLGSRIVAFFIENENATVVLQNCEENCELTGTLRYDPFTPSLFNLNQYVITDSGERIDFKSEDVAIAYWPAPN